MSVISADVVKNFYKEDPVTKWYSPKLDKIKNREQAQVVETQLVSDARMERLKAAAILVIALGAGLALAGLSYLAFQVSSLAIGVFILLVPNPLYTLITTVGGLAVGGTVGYLTLKKYAQGFLDDSKKHWQYADHLYQQAHAVRLKKAELAN